MNKVEQANDKYFRATFGEVGFAKDFLSNYLPEELVDLIDVDTLESQSTSHITKDLKDQFSDLLFKVNIMDREGYVYFLFEHKSYPDRMVIFQVLKYMIAIWEGKIKEDMDEKRKANKSYTGDLEIPLVIPLVVYHNKYEWNIKRTLGEMIPNYMDLPDSIKQYVPDFRYILSDLGFSDDDENLKEEHSMIIKTLNKTRYVSKEEVLDIFTEVVMIYTKRKDRDMVEHHVIETAVYILSSRDDITQEELSEIAGQITEEGGDLVMSAAEQLKIEAREEGIEIGERLANIETVLTLLSLKFGNISDYRKEKISELDVFTLKLMIGEVFSYKNIDDVDKYLK